MPIDWTERIASADILAASAESWRHEPVEPRIAGLVGALNATGRVRTLASCEGHALRRRGRLVYSHAPYVYFICAPETAESLSRCLWLLAADDRLHHSWIVSGGFDFAHRLGFRLWAPGIEDACTSSIGTLRRMVLGRHRIDADLALLAREMPTAIEGNTA